MFSPRTGGKGDGAWLDYLREFDNACGSVLNGRDWQKTHLVLISLAFNFGTILLKRFPLALANQRIVISRNRENQGTKTLTADVHRAGELP